MQANFPERLSQDRRRAFPPEEVREIAEAIQRVYARTLAESSTIDSAATTAK